MLTSEAAELASARSREAAIRDILNAIRENSEDEQPVFQMILQRACQLCDAPHAVVFLRNQADTHMEIAAYAGTRSEFADAFNERPQPLDDHQSHSVRAVRENRTIHVEDLTADEYSADPTPQRRHALDEAGIRTLLIVPLTTDDGAIGLILLYRREVRPFADDEIALVESFATQAVIAIENVRQFRAIQEANAALEIRLEREAATSEILGVISQSQQDSQGVFDVILENAVRLCQASNALLMLADEDRGYFDPVADYDARSVAVAALKKTPVPLSEAAGEIFTAFDRNEVRHIEDLADTERYRAGNPYRRIAVDEEGVRTLLLVPLVQSSRPIGCIMLYRREPRRFDENHVDLVKTFAAQAVIAIQNVRQFRELQTRLEREEASREILGVISQSRDDELPVFNAILSRASRLCDAPLAALILGTPEDTHSRLAAHTGAGPEMVEMFRTDPPPMDPKHSIVAQAIISGKSVHVANMQEDEAYVSGGRFVKTSRERRYADWSVGPVAVGRPDDRCYRSLPPSRTAVYPGTSHPGRDLC